MHSQLGFGFRTKKGGSKKLEIEKNVKLFFPSSVLSESGSKGVISALKAPPKVGSKLERIIGVCKCFFQSNHRYFKNNLRGLKIIIYFEITIIILYTFTVAIELVYNSVTHNSTSNPINFIKYFNQMSKKILWLFFCIGIQVTVFAQGTVSDKSQSVKMKMQPQFEFTLPPNLFVNMQFADDNGNGIIEAEEKAKLTLDISNKGSGPAQGLKVKLTSQNYDPAFYIGEEVFIREIKPEQSKKIEIPINAGFNVKTNEHKIQINVTEYFGYDMDPATLVLNTLEYQKPEIVLAGMEIFDKGEGTGTIVADGQLQAGEMVKAKIIIQNIGNNVANNVKYNVVSKDNNIFIKDGQGTLGNFSIGEVKEIWVTISPNKRVDYNGNLPLYISATPEKSVGGLTNYQLPLALNQRPPKTETLAIKADFDKMKKQVARFEYKSEKYTANITAGNIDAIPTARKKRNNAVAIVIGVEKYQNIPPAPYAAHDAEIMAKYFKETMGIEKVITHIDNEVSGFFFINTFDPNNGNLMKLINKGETDVFVYYSGHGIPEKDGKDVFLFPSDGKLEMLQVMGYSMNKFYENLNAMGAKSVTVILDACFTGSSRTSEKFTAENVSNTKGVKIRPLAIMPWQANPNFRVFTSSTNEQTSLGFDASETGLFTYYLAIGMQGDADENKDKTITAAELRNFVTSKVSETSKKIRGEQTPQFFGDDNFVVVEL